MYICIYAYVNIYLYVYKYIFLLKCAHVPGRADLVGSEIMKPMMINTNTNILHYSIKVNLVGRREHKKEREAHHISEEELRRGRHFFFF